MINQVQTAYNQYVSTHGKAPETLHCSQDVYCQISEECNTDWDGNDIRFIEALVIQDLDSGFCFK